MNNRSVYLFNQFMDEPDDPIVEEPLELSPINFKYRLNLFLYKLGVWLSKV